MTHSWPLHSNFCSTLMLHSIRHDLTPKAIHPVANIKSQIKRNRFAKPGATEAEIREAADAGDAAKANELARSATRALDKAASKGVIHQNQAANRKSAIASRAAELSKSA